MADGIPPAPRLADPDQSVAILIGAARYDRLTALPTVERNLSDLHDLLRDDRYWGLPADRCRALANPGLPSEIEGALRDAAEQTGPDGLLLVYYAGHGIVANNGALHISVRVTDASLINSTSFPYAWLRDRVATSPAQRLVILDCCYAGRAMETMDAGQLAAEMEIDRAAVLVAASRTSRAFAPEDEDYTAFTGELLRALRTGQAGGPELLTLETIWQNVRAALRSRGLPLPELRAHNPGIHVVRNAARAPEHRLTGQVLACLDRSIDPSGVARLLVLEHRADQGALAVRIDAPTDRPVQLFLGEWADVITDPPVLFIGGPLDPQRAFGVATAHPDRAAPPAFRPLAGGIGVLDLNSDPGPARQSDVKLRVFAGYFGWGPGEVEAELSDGRLIVEGPISERALGYG
jgi:Caspase domain/Uncharacterized ACR, COG1678